MINRKIRQFKYVLPLIALSGTEHEVEQHEKEKKTASAELQADENVHDRLGEPGNRHESGEHVSPDDDGEEHDADEDRVLKRFADGR